MQTKRAIASARAFLNDSNFEIIVQLLKLKPKQDWYEWYDLEGNYLKITKTKHILIHQAKKKVEATIDIYCKAKPESIIKNSYWLCSIFGVEKTILLFIGNDGILRCCYFENNTWKCNMNPILLGYQILNIIANEYIDMEARRIAIPKINIIEKKDIEEIWLSGIPVSNNELKDKIQCHLMTNQNL